jgi:flagellar hook-associated protein 2
MGIAPLAFTGVSQYSNDFQQILNRAVQIAQIPVTRLQNKDSDVLQQKTLLAGLRTDVASLASSLQALGAIASSKALGASSSDPSVVSVSNTGATNPASYTINSITSLAAAASERTINGYADSNATPVSANGSLELTVGSQDYNFTLTNNSLVGLRDAINGLNAGVTASILTTGNGNYLMVSANTPGATTLKLTDDPGGANTALLTSTNQGSNAQFQLNGIPVNQNSNLVNSVVPGITFQLLNTTNTPVTLSLTSDRSQLSSALQSFVDSYNKVHVDLQQQTGPAAGLLSGDPVVTGLSQMLRELTSYTPGAGSIKSLADLGITFDTTGKAAFNQTTLNGLSDTQVSDAFSFLGSATTGLAAFSSQLAQYSDPVTGIIQAEQAGLDETDKSLQAQITTLTDRINLMQTTLSRRLAMADSLAAELESQQQALTASLQGLNLVLYGKNPNQQ